MTFRPVALLVMLAVAGCGGAKTDADNRNAAGEVLPGSVSDAMLPVDTLRSHPPLAPYVAPTKTDRTVPGGAATKRLPAKPVATAPDNIPAPAPTPSGE